MGDNSHAAVSAWPSIALTTGGWSALGTERPPTDGQSMSALPSSSDINLFCYRERVVDLDAEITDRALDLGVTEQS